MTASNLVLPVIDGTQVGSARRAAVAEAERLGAGESESAKVALVVTELATNLARHAGGGELLLRPLTERGRVWRSSPSTAARASPASSRPCATDTRPAGATAWGLARCSGSRTGARSSPLDGAGTAVLSASGLARGPAPVGDVTVAGVSVAKHGETVCGDAWSWTTGPDGWSVLVADGLGHGPEAAARRRGGGARVSGACGATRPPTSWPRRTPRCGIPAAPPSRSRRSVRPRRAHVHRRRQHRRHDPRTRGHRRSLVSHAGHRGPRVP